MRWFGCRKIAGSRSQARSIAEIDGRLSAHSFDLQPAERRGSGRRFISLRRSTMVVLGLASATPELSGWLVHEPTRECRRFQVSGSCIEPSLTRRLGPTGHRPSRSPRRSGATTSEKLDFVSGGPGTIRPPSSTSPAPRASGSRPGTRNRLRSPERVVKRNPTWDGSRREAEARPGPMGALSCLSVAPSTCKSSGRESASLRVCSGRRWVANANHAASSDESRLPGQPSNGQSKVASANRVWVGQIPSIGMRREIGAREPSLRGPKLFVTSVFTANR